MAGNGRDRAGDQLIRMGWQSFVLEKIALCCQGKQELAAQSLILQSTQGNSAYLRHEYFGKKVPRRRGLGIPIPVSCQPLFHFII